MNVGDFVRTKDGIIDKIRQILDNNTIEIYNKNDYYYSDFISKDEIIKSSPQIIDLIEVGDYVNGYYVEDITYNSEEYVLHIITGSNYFQNPLIYNENIKTIITHEQIEAMQYRVEE